MFKASTLRKINAELDALLERTTEALITYDAEIAW